MLESSYKEPVLTRKDSLLQQPAYKKDPPHTSYRYEGHNMTVSFYLMLLCYCESAERRQARVSGLFWRKGGVIRGKLLRFRE